jgi:hypothetical protein
MGSNAIPSASQVEFTREFPVFCTVPIMQNPRRFPPPWSVEETLPITSSLDNNPALDRRRPMTV